MKIAKKHKIFAHYIKHQKTTFPRLTWINLIVPIIFGYFVVKSTHNHSPI